MLHKISPNDSVNRFIFHLALYVPNAAHNAPGRAGATTPDRTATNFLARSSWSPFMRIVRTLHYFSVISLQMYEIFNAYIVVFVLRFFI
jgi:hypothetical protein